MRSLRLKKIFVGVFMVKSNFYRLLRVVVPPKIDPNTPRMISRPSWLPIARTVLLPNASTISPACDCQAPPLDAGDCPAVAWGARVLSIS